MTDDSGIFPIPLKKPTRFTWSKANPVSLSLMLTFAGWLVVFGAQREGQKRDLMELRKSVQSLQTTVKDFGDKVDRISEKGPEVTNARYDDLAERVSRLEGNWDDARTEAGNWPRLRKRH